MLQKAHRNSNYNKSLLLYERIEFQDYFNEQLGFFFSPFSHDTRVLSIIQFFYSGGWLPLIILLYYK